MLLEKMSQARKCVGEFLGTAMLLCAVVGSGIMAERLSGGNIAVALLANTIATGAALATLILTFAHVSGAHFNPVVTFTDAVIGELSLREAFYYTGFQILGAISGVAIANLMFGLEVFNLSTKVRSGPAQWLGEFVATFGLIGVIISVSRRYSVPFVAVGVSAYITAAYWFTSSTSFANPAVTIARSLSNTFAGISPTDAPAFILAEILGAAAASIIFNWLVPKNNEQ